MTVNFEFEIGAKVRAKFTDDVGYVEGLHFDGGGQLFLVRFDFAKKGSKYLRHSEIEPSE